MAYLSNFSQFIRHKLKNYFFTGLLLVVPVALTFLVVRWLVNLMDSMLISVLPGTLHPDLLFGISIPGVGLVATLLLILAIGMLAANIFGRQHADCQDQQQRCHQADPGD